MPGDVTLLEPGAESPVVLEADGNGDVPEYGDLVGIVGESSRGTHVSYPAAEGEAVGHLVGPPADVDEDATFDANEVVGEAMVKLRHAVDWLPQTSGDWVPSTTETESPSPNDQAVSLTDGSVRGRDGDSADAVIGRVWTTVQRAEGTASKVAVVRVR